ncbi:hypothetical protein [Fischerella sp. JS2]|uniref:hypothetical protein n=1 Tax=Fischerella sp. JS2 TaxID=2597771 RepID=UPI0028EB80D0|nr:hypothetical protein [Fischerella sp. JS2]
MYLLLSITKTRGRTVIVYSQIKAAVFNQFALKHQSKRQSKSVGDLRAATAIQHNLILVSADSDFVQIQQPQPFLVKF